MNEDKDSVPYTLAYSSLLLDSAQALFGSFLGQSLEPGAGEIPLQF